jgi:hypothetical protein
MRRNISTIFAHVTAHIVAAVNLAGARTIAAATSVRQWTGKHDRSQYQGNSSFMVLHDVLF